MPSTLRSSTSSGLNSGAFQHGAASIHQGEKPIPKPMLRHAFEKAVGDAKVEDFQFRDFRHCARTRWAAAGLPFEIGELGIGHKLRGIAGRYINLSDDQIRIAFAEMYRKIGPSLSQEKSGTEE